MSNLELITDYIENNTDHDVLFSDDFELNVINRFGSDGAVHTIGIYNKTTSEIVSIINSL